MRLELVPFLFVYTAACRDDMMDGHGTMMCGGHHGMDDHRNP